MFFKLVINSKIVSATYGKNCHLGGSLGLVVIGGDAVLKGVSLIPSQHRILVGQCFRGNCCKNYSLFEKTKINEEEVVDLIAHYFLCYTQCRHAILH